MGNIPNIRFKGFTDDWEQRKLGDVVEFLDTMRKPLEGAKRISGPYPYYGASGIVDYVDGYLFDEELVLLSEDGANITDRNYPVCFLASGKYWVNNHAHVLKTKDGNENNFICNSLERKDYKQYNSGMAMPKLNQEVCRGIPISCPSFDEQKKIGDYFRNLDHLITLHQRKCEETKELKKYMLQKMFPKKGEKKPEIRFAGFTDDWEQRKLIEVCDYVDYRGKTPTKTKEGIFLVTAKNVKDGFIDYETSKEYISDDAYEEVMHRGKPEVGDVLITTEAPCGNVAQVNNANIALAQRIIKYRGHIGVVDNTYLKYYLLFPEFQKTLNAKSSGGTVQGIKGSVLHQQKIKYPSYEEQKKIGQHMNNLDNLITLHQRKLEKLENLKKSMLKQMLL